MSAVHLFTCNQVQVAEKGERQRQRLTQRHTEIIARPTHCKVSVNDINSASHCLSPCCSFFELILPACSNYIQCTVCPIIPDGLHATQVGRTWFDLHVSSVSVSSWSFSLIHFTSSYLLSSSLDLVVSDTEMTIFCLSFPILISHFRLQPHFGLSHIQCISTAACLTLSCHVLPCLLIPSLHSSHLIFSHSLTHALAHALAHAHTPIAPRITLLM